MSNILSITETWIPRKTTLTTGNCERGFSTQYRESTSESDGNQNRDRQARRVIR